MDFLNVRYSYYNEVTDVITLIFLCYYRSVPGKRPPHGKRPGSHFRGMNGERPLPGKRPGILSTVRNGKRPGHVSIFNQFFTIFFGPSTIKLSRISFPSKLSVPYSIASAVRYDVRYMECMRIGNVACTHTHASTLTPPTSIFTHGKRPVR